MVDLLGMPGEVPSTSQQKADTGCWGLPGRGLTADSWAGTGDRHSLGSSVQPSEDPKTRMQAIVGEDKWSRERSVGQCPEAVMGSSATGGE